MSGSKFLGNKKQTRTNHSGQDTGKPLHMITRTYNNGTKKRKYYESAGQAHKAFSMTPRSNDYTTSPPNQVTRKLEDWE